MGKPNTKVLGAWIGAVASHIKQSTQGQYVDQDSKSLDFYIKIKMEGGINVLHNIKEKAAKELRRAPQRADTYFYEFLKEMLGMENQISCPNTGFYCYENSLEWKSARSFRRGYILMGNSTDRPTSLPFFQYYLIFLPLFQEHIETPSEKEIYFDFTQIQGLGNTPAAESAKEKITEEASEDYGEVKKELSQRTQRIKAYPLAPHCLPYQADDFNFCLTKLETLAEEMLKYNYLPNQALGLLESIEESTLAFIQNTAPREQKIEKFKNLLDTLKQEIEKVQNELDQIILYGEEFREPIQKFSTLVLLYGAASELTQKSHVAHKKLYESEKNRYFNIIKKIFENNYIQKTRVFSYTKTENGELIKQTDYLEVSDKSENTAKEGYDMQFVFQKTAVEKFNPYFNKTYPSYPRFTDLRHPLQKDNLARQTHNALRMIVDPNKNKNNDGAAILKGLGLLIKIASKNNEEHYQINIDNSIYAQKLKQKIEANGPKGALNINEVFKPVPQSYEKYWQTAWMDNVEGSDNDQIEIELGFLVVCAAVKVGELEIHFQKEEDKINSLNLEQTLSWNTEKYRSFLYLKKQQDIPILEINRLLKTLELPLEATQLQSPESLKIFQETVVSLQSKFLQTSELLKQNIRCRQFELFSEEEIQSSRLTLKFCTDYFDRLKIFDEWHKFKNFDQLKNAELCEKIIASKAIVQKVEWLKNWADKIDNLLKYLNSANSYLPLSQESLKKKIENEALNNAQNWKNILALESREEAEALLLKWEALLLALQQQYVEYYYKAYQTYHIDEKENKLKEEILHSENKKIADCLKRFSFIGNTRPYDEWLNSIDRIKKCDRTVTPELIKKEPYQNFDPKAFDGQAFEKLEKLGAKLDAIVQGWENNLREQLKDPGLQENINLLLNEQEKNVLRNFQEGKEKIRTGNQAMEIGRLMNKVMQSFEKIEVDLNEIAGQFQKLLTPAELENIFKNWIEQRCKGKERDKIRFIIR